jgi:hypothetical protein
MDSTYVLKHSDLDPLEICDLTVTQLREVYPEEIIAVDRNPCRPVIYMRGCSMSIVRPSS